MQFKRAIGRRSARRSVSAAAFARENKQVICALLAAIDLVYYSARKRVERQIDHPFAIESNAEPIIAYLPSLFLASMQHHLESAQPVDRTINMIDVVS